MDAIEFAVAAAVHSPSVHNTQPWRFGHGDRSIDVYADAGRRLRVADPAGRELMISCGAAVFTLRVALRYLGWLPRARLFPDPSRPALVARVCWDEDRITADSYEREMYAAVTTRYTHRAGFGPAALPAGTISALRAEAAIQGTMLRLVPPGDRLDALAAAVQAGEHALRLDSGRAAELADWVVPPDSPRRDGIPPAAYPAEPAHTEPDFPGRDFAAGHDWGLAAPAAGERSAGVVCLLATSANEPADWVAAGQALQRVLLRAAACGVAAALHSQPLELPQLRDFIRVQLAARAHPQLIILSASPARLARSASAARSERSYSELGGAMAGKSVLECRGLRRRFGDIAAVDGVGFHIGTGETYGLLGPNGAGKTTSISMIAGLLERDAGEVLVAGEPMTTRSVRAKNAIGYVPQDLAIYPDLTGRENLMFFARLYSMPTPAAKRRTDEVLALTGLADRAGDQTKQYSGGMKRRLNIGIGLLHQPKLLILDEPTVGVDPQSRNAILESVEGLSGAGMAVLYTTHYMEEAERLCDRIGIIDHGKLIAEGTRADLVGMVGEGDQVRLSATGDLEKAAGALATRSWVRQAKALDGSIDLVVENASSELPAILTDVAAAGAIVRSVEVAEPDLEAVFLHLTGRALRD